ncbi:MAG TPA: helix-turn-helix domain-containing protein [Thermoanaerobaculia bacterium]|jgi:excisionase family DNA binding protein|nr:helix-turn-helix domain-containing protein [Thermoanaerobaculia bacterium]
MTHMQGSSENGAAAPVGGGFLSRSAVAGLFGVSASTVTRWARTGLIRSVRTPGGHYRFPADEIRRAADRAAADELVKLD